MKRIDLPQKHLFCFFSFVFLIFLTTNVSAVFTGNISISYPVDLGAYVSNVSTINYTVNSTQSCWYSTDSGTTNSSSVSPGTAFTGLSLGTSNLTVYCNNSAGDVGQNNISFIVGNYDITNEVNKIMASDANASDYFGYSISISGNYAIVGAYGKDTVGGGGDGGAGGTDTGAAYIYKKNSTGQYEEVNKITASDAQVGDYFGYSVSISGDYAIVGAYGKDTVGTDAGVAYIYKKNSTGQYEEVNKIMASDAQASDWFGYSISISGDYVIVGAYYESTGGSGAGAAYIYKKNSTGQYEEVNKIMASDAQVGDYFGYSVSISGDYAIVGAYNEGTGGKGVGAAYIFKKNSTGQYEEVNKIMASDAQAADNFGYSVSISGDYAIVGASSEGTGGTNAGAAYIYKKNSTGQYEEVNKIMASDAQASDWFGYSISISGDYAIVGAWGETTGGSSAGAAYIYKKNSTGKYEEVNKIMASDAQAGDRFGTSVSISGDYAVVGASIEDTGGSSAGAAYSFQMDYETPNITLISPANATSSTTNAYNFTFNVTDNQSISDCSLIFDGSIINTLTSVNNSGGTNGMYNSSLSVATHTWSVNCTNVYGKVGNSSTRTLIVGAVAVVTTTTPSSGGSGGYPVYYPTKEQTKNGYSKSIRKNWKIEFKIENESYELKLSSLNITNKTAKITISSNPQTKTLFIGEEWSVNLNNNSYYDLSVKLNSIKNDWANFTIQSINEKINPKTVEEKQKKQKDIIKDNNPNWNINKRLVSILSTIIAPIGLIYYFYYKKQKKYSN